MPRHRVKNVTTFEGDDYDDDDDYEEEDELSPEDREHMRLGTIEVRQLLQSEIPPVPATDEEIQEALWHYFYDVDKSVGFLRSKARQFPARRGPYADFIQRSMDRKSSQRRRSRRKQKVSANTFH